MKTSVYEIGLKTCFYWTFMWHGKNACKPSPAHCCYSSFGWSKHAFAFMILHKYQQGLPFSNPMNLSQSMRLCKCHRNLILDIWSTPDKRFEPVLYLFLFFFWWESDGFFSIIISDVVYSMLKLQKISRGMREVTECLWISYGVWTQQVWRVCQLIC